MTDKNISKFLKDKKYHINRKELEEILNSIQVTGYEVIGKSKSFKFIKININTGENYKAMLIGEEDGKEM